MKTITYNLLDNKKNSDEYYERISKFSDQVFAQAYQSFGDFMKEFDKQCFDSITFTKKTINEKMIDIITVGVLLQEYWVLSESIHPGLRSLLHFFTNRRYKIKYLKPILDKVKGVIMTITLSTAHGRDKESQYPSLETVKSVILCLEAFGDFEEETKVLSEWYRILHKIDWQNKNILQEIYNFASWFKKESNQVLGNYTSNVENFISQNTEFYHWREDRIFCLRRPVEYHLNMVCAELMSREYRNDFLKSDIKRVLLPACMRSRPESSCKANSMQFGKVCVGCTKECIVNRITKLGNEMGFTVSIISHESAAFVRKEECGIIGVSCVTRLLEGGYKAKELGMYPQCVLLDYCGCKKHWDKEGIPTSINIEKLKSFFQETVS